MDEKDSFSSIGGQPVKAIPLSDYIENAGAVHSSICQFGDYIYFTSENGYLWRGEIKTFSGEKPQFEYLKLSGNSSSTPTVTGNYVFVGTWEKTENSLGLGSVDIISIAAGAFEKVAVIGEVGEVYASPIVSREEDRYYIYFTSYGMTGHGYCYLYKDNTISKVWETDAYCALQGMSAGEGFLVYGDGNSRLHIIK